MARVLLGESFQVASINKCLKGCFLKSQVMVPATQQFRERRQTGALALVRKIQQAVADVQRLGYCWSSWQPQVVALATPIVVNDQPIYALNMSVTTEAEPEKVVDQLSEPLLALRRRMHQAIAYL